MRDEVGGISGSCWVVWRYEYDRLHAFPFSRIQELASGVDGWEESLGGVEREWEGLYAEYLECHEHVEVLSMRSQFEFPSVGVCFNPTKREATGKGCEPRKERTKRRTHGTGMITLSPRSQSAMTVLKKA